jgi:hypothetical protein
MARAVAREQNISRITDIMASHRWVPQPTQKIGEIMDIQGKEVDLVAPLRNTKRLVG